MSRGNRNILATIGAVALIASVIAVITWPRVPQLQPYRYERARSEKYRPGGSECRPATLASIGNSGKRASQTDACAEKAEEYRLNTNDLIQQTRAADAAKAGAEIASQGLWTAWFQTIGGFVTLAAAIAAAIYARVAAQETKRAADTADASLAATLEAQRSRLTFGNWQTLQTLSDSGDVIGYRVRPMWKNTGGVATLTTGVETAFSFVTVEEIRSCVEISCVEPRAENHSVGSYERFGPAPFEIDVETMIALWEKRKHIVLYCVVRYSDSLQLNSIWRDEATAIMNILCDPKNIIKDTEADRLVQYHICTNFRVFNPKTGFVSIKAREADPNIPPAADAPKWRGGNVIRAEFDYT